MSTQANPREVGELLATWVGVKLDEVDALVAAANAKAAAIPEWRTLATIVGELVIRIHALELEVGELRKAAKP